MPYCCALRHRAIQPRGRPGLQDRGGSVHLRALPAGRRPDLSLLVWTTTPWTLISNVAAAISPEIPYVEVKSDGQANDHGRAAGGEGARRRRTRSSAEIPVSELAGKCLHCRLTISSTPEQKAHYVVSADFVSADEGTGIVHIAPAFGADDLHGRPRARPAGDQRRSPKKGCSTSGSRPGPACSSRTPTPTSSMSCGSAACCWPHVPYEHSYPHCWRCDTPLIYYAKASWYIKTTAIKDELLAANESVTWYPGAHQARPLRQLAGEQHRLGALARTLLGHAAAGLALRGRPRASASAAWRSWRRWPSTDPAEDLDLHRPFIDDSEAEVPRLRRAR